MTLFRLAAFFILLSVSCPLAVQAQDQPLCEARDWFAPQTATQRQPSPLCKGVQAAGLGRDAEGAKLLHSLIQQQPSSKQAYRALEVLLSLHFRNGRFHEALAAADAMLLIKPGTPDITELRPLLLAFSGHPDLTIQRKRSLLPYLPAADPNPHLPVTVNGAKGLFYMDTGANISSMSDAEAKELKLNVQTVSSKMGDISGNAMSLRTTEVNDLWIGKTHLQHVSFIVLPSSQPPFNDIPPSQQAILGIQVILALKTIHVGKDNRIEVAGPGPSHEPGTPLAFYQSQPLIQMSFNNSPLIFSLDTGAVHTTLNPAFAERFADAVAQGTRKEHVLTGQGGSTIQDSVELKDLSFALAGTPVTVGNVPVLLKTTTAMSTWTAGNLGYDLIRQTAPFTLDFKQMKLFAKVP